MATKPDKPTYIVVKIFLFFNVGLVFFVLILQVMWHAVDFLILKVNHDPPFLHNFFLGGQR